MNLDINSIKNPQVRVFYSLWWSQHLILYDFFNLLTETQFDYRMVDTLERKSDTPRESLAHILYVQLVYLNSVKTGKLEFKSMGIENYRTIWNLALMDHLKVPRFASLIQYWGP